MLLLSELNALCIAKSLQNNWSCIRSKLVEKSISKVKHFVIAFSKNDSFWCIMHWLVTFLNWVVFHESTPLVLAQKMTIFVDLEGQRWPWRRLLWRSSSFTLLLLLGDFQPQICGPWSNQQNKPEKGLGPEIFLKILVSFPKSSIRDNSFRYFVSPCIGIETPFYLLLLADFSWPSIET